MKILLLSLFIFVYGLAIDGKVFIDIKQAVDIPKFKHDISIYSFSIENKNIKPFYIAKYETTVKEYKKYTNKIGVEFTISEDIDENEPISNIDFNTAQNVCKFYGGRLPTELEWVVAASIKASYSKCYQDIKKDSFYPYSTATYPLSENDKQVKCMSEDDDEIEASLIGSELLEVQYSYENINGTYGMLGNVWEWVDDEKKYFNQQYKVIKGGSFTNFKEKVLFDNRVSNFLKPESKMPNVGFRCVWSDKNSKYKQQIK